LPSPFTFDNRVQLLAAATDFTHEAVQIHLRWRLQQIGRYDLQFTLRDENGHVWNQLNTPLLNSTDFYPEHWASGETPQVRYTLSPPAAMPPGPYTVDLALFDAPTSAQLPLLTADNTFRGVVYDLPAVDIPSPAKLALVSELDIGNIVNQGWLEDRLILWGHKPLPDSLLSGSRTVLNVYWQAVAPLPAAVQIQLQVGDSVTTMPLSRYPSADWRVGEPVHEKYDLVIPPDLPAGLVSVTLKPASGTDTAVSLGQIEIIATDRQFQLPDNLDTTLNLQFGSDMVLRGMKGPTVPGDTLSITLAVELGATIPLPKK
jgi:hypothetical protein